MKKFIIGMVLMVMVTVGLAATISVDKNKALTDGELVERYLIEEEGLEIDRVELEPTEDEYINYIAYNDGKVILGGSIDRGYAEHCVLK